MDLTLDDTEAAFRDEVRSWLEENHPGREPHGDEAAFKFRRDWQKRMHEAGWAEAVDACLETAERTHGRGA